MLVEFFFDLKAFSAILLLMMARYLHEGYGPFEPSTFHQSTTRAHPLSHSWGFRAFGTRIGRFFYVFDLFLHAEGGKIYGGRKVYKIFFHVWIYSILQLLYEEKENFELGLRLVRHGK